jgi:gamma-glutamylcyclotransferase (GGCT)/AIG2-like uncharacterized protein YtfP
VIDPRALAAEHRLASYGTLAPGRPNHHQLSTLEGRWVRGSVRGTIVAAGRRPHVGFPALILEAAGDEVMVDVFESADLPAHWSRLDAFEGPGYHRVVSTVSTSDGEIEASIYVLAEDERALS